jgi:hypothetical protein
MDLNHKELSNALLQLGDSIKPSVVITGEMAENAFDLAATAALIKAYEFCKEATEADPKNSFFLLASLRGICEDYIALKFIHDKAGPVKNEVVHLRLLEEAHESSIAQWQFFKENRPSQRLYYRDSFDQELEQVRADLRKLLKEHPINRNASMPSIYYMADKIGVRHLYQYIYHATSKFVHFSPRMLLRMGWEGPPRFTVTTTNFGDYYLHFCVFYGTFLLIVIFEWLSSINGTAILDKNPFPLTLLREYLQTTPRWPELVTFEEMDIGALSRNLFFKTPDEIGDLI